MAVEGKVGVKQVVVRLAVPLAMVVVDVVVALVILTAERLVAEELLGVAAAAEVVPVAMGKRAKEMRAAVQTE